MKKKAWRVLNNQQLKYPTQATNREFLNIISLFLNRVKTDIPFCFFL